MQVAHEGGKMGWSVPKETVDFFTDIRKPLLRSTPLVVLDSCPRKFLYAFRLGIQPRTYEGALQTGTIVHKMLEVLFLGKEEGDAMLTAERILAKEQTRLIEVVDKMGFVGGKPLEKVLSQLEQDYHKARAMALTFWRTTPFDPDQYEVLHDPEGTPMVEVTLDLKYPGLSRPIRTPCDLALIHRGTGGVWIVDYKTSSYSPKKRGATTRFSTQMGLYRLGLQTTLDKWHEDGLAPKRTVTGSIHALIQTPGIRYCPDTKDEDGFHSYIERMIKWYKDKEAADPNDPPMALDPHRFTGPVVSRELWGRLKQYCKASQASPNADTFYRNDGACFQYNKLCPYSDLCNSAPAMWPGLIRDKFDIRFREDEE